MHGIRINLAFPAENKLEQASTAAPAEKASPQLPEAVPEIEQEVQLVLSYCQLYLLKQAALVCGEELGVILQAQPAEPIPQPVAQNTITVAYQTGWKRVMLHYRADGQGTSQPAV